MPDAKLDLTHRLTVEDKLAQPSAVELDVDAMRDKGDALKGHLNLGITGSSPRDIPEGQLLLNRLASDDRPKEVLSFPISQCREIHRPIAPLDRAREALAVRR